MKGRNMTRWRDPAKDPRQAPKSALITAEGAERLRGILDHLSRVKRPALSAKVGEAAALGDRSENADYTYNKKELNRVIARIRYLTKRLDELTVVDRLPADTDKVFFGAFVTLEDEAGEELYRYVSTLKDDLLESEYFDADELAEGGEAEKLDPDEARRQEKIENAQRMRNLGKSTTEVAKNIGMSQSWVSQYTENPNDNDADTIEA